MSPITDGYGRRRPVGITDPRRVITAGDLRDPISLVRSSRQPDQTTGFQQTLTPYWNGWAHVAHAEERRVGSANAANELIHVFTTRTPLGERLGIDGYVYYDGRIFAIDSTKRIGHRNEWTVIKAKEDTALLSAGATIEDQETPADFPVPTDANPFWPDEPEDELIVRGEYVMDGEVDLTT